MGFVGIIFTFFYGIVMLISIGVTILYLISMWNLFKKAGEPAWSSLIPIYNYMKMIKISIGDFKLAWVYLALSIGDIIVLFMSKIITVFVRHMASHSRLIAGIMSISLVIMSLLTIIIGLALCALQIYISYMFPKSFGKGTVFCVLSIFFTPIMTIIMGFNVFTTYVGPKGRYKGEFL